ncbi:glycosyltransferase [Klenkia terrae]|uniref:glycosyltransferase n=1 Tax=Klenkia terrae TaxID=1052259 RepID=UPI003607814C
MDAETDPLRVVAVTYSPGASLESFIASLGSATTRPVEVVLADNGSTDGAPERVAAGRGDVRVLPTGGNVGYGAAVDAGLAGATGRWAVVANPDVVFEPGSIDALLAAAQRWPRAGAVGPAIRTPDGELYPSARDLPSLSTGAGHAALGWVWPGNPWTARYRREREAPRERTAGWLSGSCFVIDLDAYRTIGGSTRATSCTSRTWTSGNGSVGPGTSTSTRRRPSWCTRAGTPPAASRTAWPGCTTPARCAIWPAATRGAATRRSAWGCAWAWAVGCCCPT